MGNQTMVTSAGEGSAGWGGGEASEVAGSLGAKSCRRGARGQEMADDEREIDMGPLSSSFDSIIVAHVQTRTSEDKSQIRLNF